MRKSEGKEVGKQRGSRLLKLACTNPINSVNLIHLINQSTPEPLSFDLYPLTFHLYPLAFDLYPLAFDLYPLAFDLYPLAFIL
jgi:hypothetical protein